MRIKELNLWEFHPQQGKVGRWARQSIKESVLRATEGNGYSIEDLSTALDYYSFLEDKAERLVEKRRPKSIKKPSHPIRDILIDEAVLLPITFTILYNFFR